MMKTKTKVFPGDFGNVVLVVSPDICLKKTGVALGSIAIFPPETGYSTKNRFVGIGSKKQPNLESGHHAHNLMFFVGTRVGESMEKECGRPAWAFRNSHNKDELQEHGIIICPQ